MNNIKSIISFCIIISITSCVEKDKKNDVVETPKTITQKVDDVNNQIKSEISDYNEITVLDHHRMAEAAGVYTPPSIATIFSEIAVNTPLVAKNQLIGLDLPFKILAYSEPDTTQVSIAYTSTEFIKKRHELSDDILSDYNNKINSVIEKLPGDLLSKTNTNSVTKNFGIIKIQSDFDFDTTVQNLKNVVMAQGDTEWFADIDYKNEASSLDVDIRPTMLLLFGGPAPGGKAMMTTPKIGLDAFCQKLLVYQDENETVWVAFNDIVAFSTLYYNTSTKPQQLINKRLEMTFSKAVKNEIDN